MIRGLQERRKQMERIRPMQCGGLGLHELEESEDEAGGWWDQPVKGLLY